MTGFFSFPSWKSTVTSKFTIFADHVGSSKIFVHISEEEMDSIPVYEEVFSSDEEDDEPENADGEFLLLLTSSLRHN